MHLSPYYSLHACIITCLNSELPYSITSFYVWGKTAWYVTCIMSSVNSFISVFASLEYFYLFIPLPNVKDINVKNIGQNIHRQRRIYNYGRIKQKKL